MSAPSASTSWIAPSWRSNDTTSNDRDGYSESLVLANKLVNNSTTLTAVNQPVNQPSTKVVPSNPNPTAVQNRKLLNELAKNGSSWPLGQRSQANTPTMSRANGKNW